MFTLTNFVPDALTFGAGNRFHIEVEGFGPVIIEDWFTESQAGSDVYRVVTLSGGGLKDQVVSVECSRELEAHLGVALFEYLMGDYLHAVAEAYWGRLLGDPAYLELTTKAQADAQAVPTIP